MPDEPEVLGLLALLLLTDARRASRVTVDGSLVLLPDQDRPFWDAGMVAEGHRLVRQGLRRSHPGPYQIQAAIGAVHTDAAAAADTDWRQILTLYDQLLRYTPTSVVVLNRAVALAEIDGPGAALADIDTLNLANYQHFHAVRGDFLFRLGRFRESAVEYAAARALAGNDTEQRFLDQRRRAAEDAAEGDR